MKQEQHQGKFHLLAIFFIPTLLVTAFLLENPWIIGIVSVLLVVILYFLFFRKKKP